VQGEVRRPGTFGYRDSFSLKDLILQAGGFTDAAYPQRIEIARVIRRDTLTAQDVRLSQILDVKSLDDFASNGHDVALHPFDIVTVRRLPGYVELQSVNASGQVQFPGPYVLSTRLEKISDLLKRAGGLTPEAFPDAAYLRRKSERDMSSEIEAQTVEKIQRQLRDTTGQVTATIRREFDQVPLDLAKIISTPGSESDLILKAGDELFIPRNDEEIRITGEVLFPTLSPFNTTKSFRDYVGEAGGFTDNARRKRAYVLYPNGKASSTHNFLFIRNYPAIKPGSEIVVPKVAERTRPRRGAAETVGLASALASLAYIVIAIIRL
jgi:protein involved in polysaccharide export with SLBB domain